MFAVFWNEYPNVDGSLSQIVNMNPDWIHISEGCFDLKQPSKSTDGTRERILNWAETRDNVTIHSPVRLTRFQHLLRDASTFLSGGFGRDLFALALFLRRSITSSYRLNQSETLNKMMETHNKKSENYWFVTCDADEYFSQSAMEVISRIRSINGFDMLVASEITFCEPQNSIAPWYPSQVFRTWNVPILHRKGMKFLFTRELYASSDFKKSRLRKFSSNARIGFIGWIYHLKIDSERIEVGLKLGDRKPPKPRRMESVPFVADPPKEILRPR